MAKSKYTDCMKILDYMRQHNNRITIREIQTKLQINGATARMSDLKIKHGYSFDINRATNPNTGARYNVYTLIEEARP